MSRGDATQASCHDAPLPSPSAPTAGLTGRPADSSPQLPAMCCPSKYTHVPSDTHTAATGTQPVCSGFTSTLFDPLFVLPEGTGAPLLSSHVSQA